MGFNYLQTDDRDDYFASIGYKKEYEFALYSDPGNIVIAVNKNDAMKKLQVSDRSLVGMLDPQKNWIKSKKSKGFKTR